MPDHIFLVLENVKGKHSAGFLSVAINGQDIGTVALFGLNLASQECSHGGGNGIHKSFHLSYIFDQMHLDGQLDINALDIQVKVNSTISEQRPIEVERISIYRQSS